jgi:hypothetical protein
VKGGDPLRAVPAPEEHAVSWTNAALNQKRGKTTGETRDLTVCGDPPPIALVAHHGNRPAIAAKIVKESSQMVAHRRSGMNRGLISGCWMQERGLRSSQSWFFSFLLRHGSSRPLAKPPAPLEPANPRAVKLNFPWFPATKVVVRLPIMARGPNIFPLEIPAILNRLQVP